MNTIIYMVRHAESPYAGNERTRGLTPIGKLSAETITNLLRDEGVDVILSSPYARAVLTLEGLAKELGLEIKTNEDLRERHFSDDVIPDEHFMPFLKKSFEDPSYSLPGGESSAACQHRSVTVLKSILDECKGQKIAIGTHGNVMTRMMNYFDPRYEFDFMNETTKPDVYKLQFEDLELQAVTRLWTEQKDREA
ncbi:histidine phosphatase family protein [Paenibacillus albicereus]|uniref:Histidine phosphatase family protein n=1 Tax=Paenibacillus albicereus TaxID=2726185 RepID=A0A6H2GU23_9BACL|nr:histidine phosphatase family protein [Paenibacillus albicereus]QJC50910.1 histidine phosphatase family protein [Paenibacillus albicereus]